MISLLRGALALTLFCCAGVATSASAVTMTFADRATFLNASTGPVVIETFNGLMTGKKSNTLILANSTIVNNVGLTITTDSGICPNSSNCLVSNDANDVRVISDFSANTTGFALDLRAVSSTDVFQVLVLTNLGVRTFNYTTLPNFFGFREDAGILSVSFINNGSGGRNEGNYGFDNISTFTGASPPAVPEPSTWAMILLGFGVLGVSARTTSRRRERSRLS